MDDREYPYQLFEKIKQYVLEFGSIIVPRSFPFIIISREKECFVSPAGNQVISICNHGEANTYLVITCFYLLLHASEADSDIAVVCKDTDVLILKIWAY